MKRPSPRWDQWKRDVDAVETAAYELLAEGQASFTETQMLRHMEKEGSSIVPARRPREGKKQSERPLLQAWRNKLSRIIIGMVRQGTVERTGVGDDARYRVRFDKLAAATHRDSLVHHLLTIPVTGMSEVYAVVPVDSSDGPSHGFRLGVGLLVIDGAGESGPPPNLVAAVHRCRQILKRALTAREHGGDGKRVDVVLTF